jgi:hypothetical protein
LFVKERLEGGEPWHIPLVVKAPVDENAGFFLAWSAFVNCTDQLFRPVFAFRWFIMNNFIRIQPFCCCREPALYRFFRRSLLILFYSFSESVKEQACAWRGIVSPIA